MFSLIRLLNDGGEPTWICLTDFKTRGGGVLHIRTYFKDHYHLLSYKRFHSEDLSHIIIPGEFT